MLTWSKLLDKYQLLARRIEYNYRNAVVDLQQVPVFLHLVLRVVHPEWFHVWRIRWKWTEVNVLDVLHLFWFIQLIVLNGIWLIGGMFKVCPKNEAQCC